MSAAQVPVRRIGIGIALAATLLSSACAAGQHAQTADVKPTLDGVNVNAGPIALRGLAVEPPDGITPYYPVGSDAQLKLVLINTGNSTDTLTQISSPIASDWAAYASTSEAEAVLAADASTAAPTSTAPSSAAAPSSPTGTKSHRHRSGAAGSSTSSSSASAPSASPLPTAIPAIPIPAGGRVSWGVPESTRELLLLHITKRIYPGTTVSITFTFQNAGSVTVSVPVALSNAPNTSVIPAPPATTGIGR